MFLKRNRHLLLLSGPKIYITGPWEELTNKKLCFQVALSGRFGGFLARKSAVLAVFLPGMSISGQKSSILVDSITSFDVFLARNPPILPTFTICAKFLTYWCLIGPHSFRSTGLPYQCTIPIGRHKLFL